MKELETTLEQSIEVTRELGIRLKAIRPYLFLNNLTIRNFRLAVFSGSTEVATTATFTAQNLKDSLSTANSYCAVNYYIRFSQSVFLKKGIYTVRLISSSYSYSTSEFIAWIIEHENEKNAMSYVRLNDTENSFAFDLFRF